MKQSELTQAIDAILSEEYKDNEPGAAVIVTKNGETIFRKGYGMANLEHNIPMTADMVLRIGSVTKQFTAVGILMLFEQGKLDLQDDITKFLPDFPTHGHTLTVEHLLTHTSGIKSYTEMKEWMDVITKDLSLDELIGISKNEPMEFAPGTDWNYNNSGYVLLGAVIEKASGMKYEDFIVENIFKPLGMNNSYYDMPEKIIPNRASGYDKAENGFANCKYLSMTQPHAAGSLASTVDDLAKWNEALFNAKLLKKETIKKAHTPYVTSKGVNTGYGYGWAIGEVQGHHLVAHGGGIHGFICDGIRFEDEHVYAAILTNRGWETPDMSTFKIGALATGKPYVEPETIKLSPEKLETLRGVYENKSFGADLIIDVEEDHLSLSMMGRPSKIYPESETLFFDKESLNKYEFVLKNGKSETVIMGGLYGPGMPFAITDKPLPSDKKTIELDEAYTDQLLGNYVVAPGMSIMVLKKDGKLMAQSPGNEPGELLAETETKFFIKDAGLEIFFDKDENGQIAGLHLEIGGQEYKAKKE